MAQLNVDDVARQLSRAFDFLQDSPITLATSVSPVILVGPGTPAPYDSQFRWARADSVTGDATHPGLVAVINPSVSGELVIIDELQLTAQAAVQNFQVEMYYGALLAPPATIESTFAPTVPGVDTDSRQRATSPSPLTSTNRIFLVTNQTPVGLANTIVLGTYRSPVDTPVRIPITPVILAPNCGLFFGGSVNAGTWLYGVVGRTFPVRQK